MKLSRLKIKHCEYFIAARSHLSRFRLVRNSLYTIFFLRPCSNYMQYNFTYRGLCMCIIARKKNLVKLRATAPVSAFFLFIAVFCIHQLTVIGETLMSSIRHTKYKQCWEIWNGFSTFEKRIIYIIIFECDYTSKITNLLQSFSI